MPKATPFIEKTGLSLAAYFWAIFCTLSLALLSWTPGPYMVRSGVLSGHEEHFLAYFLSALFISKTQRRTTPSLWTGLALAVYAGLLEIGQLYVPGRHPAVEDFCASAVGAFVGVAMASVLGRLVETLDAKL